MSKSYDEGYENADEEVWTCTTDTASQTYSDYTITEKLSTFGGPETLIKTDLSVAELNSPDFNVRFKVTADTEGAAVRVDSVKVRAFYRRPLTTDPIDSRRPTALASVAENGGRFVVVGAGGRVVTSDDEGQTWTERTSNVTYDLWDIRPISDGFIAVGDKGTIITSPDGVTWTTQNSGTDAPLRAVGRNNLAIFVVGKSGTSLNSLDKLSWRPV